MNGFYFCGEVVSYKQDPREPSLMIETVDNDGLENTHPVFVPMSCKAPPDMKDKYCRFNIEPGSRIAVSGYIFSYRERANSKRMTNRLVATEISRYEPEAKREKGD
jgi:hypothetical protein